VIIFPLLLVVFSLLFVVFSLLFCKILSFSPYGSLLVMSTAWETSLYCSRFLGGHIAPPVRVCGLCAVCRDTAMPCPPCARRERCFGFAQHDKMQNGVPARYTCSGQLQKNQRVSLVL
jgi:hypothetical protein